MLRFLLLLLFPVLLVAKEITILSPTGGEVLKCDSTYMARWTYTAKAGGDRFQVFILPKNALSIVFLAQKTFTTGATRADSLSFTMLPFNQSMDSCRILVMDVLSTRNIDSSGYFSVIQERPDPYEPNQDTAHAYRISMNDSLGSALIGPYISDYDYDYFKTNLLAGDHIDFIVRKQAALYYLYYLAIGPDGKTITSGSWTGTDADSIRHKCSLIAYQSGSYYLALYAASSYTGHYSVALKPHSGNITLVPPTGITTYSAESTYVFSFTGSNFFSAPQLFAKSDPGSPVSLYLGSFRTTNTISCKMPLINSTTPILFFIFEPDGGSAALSDTSATFSLTTLKPDPYEPNDDPANAFEIIPGDSLANAILGTTFSAKCDTDYYRFSGTAGNTYELRISAVAGSGTPSAYLQVISPNGTPLDAAMYYSGPGSKCLGAPISGNYMLKIYYYTPSASWRYNLVFNSVEAGEYIFSAPLAGDIWPCDTFNIIRWTSQNVGATVGIEMCLDGNFWYPLTSVSGQQNTGTSSPFFFPIKATNPNVRLRLYDYSGTGLVATDTSAPFTLKVDRPDIYEPNNDSLSPWLLHSGDSLSEGYIHYPSGLTALDSDWFAFNALAGDTVKFPVKLLPHASGFFVYLYPPATSSPLTYYISSGLGSMTPLVAPKSGKYLLRIAGSSFASCGRYTLQFYNSSGRTADCSLAVISPKTGDAFSAGSIQTITWINFGQIPLVKILLLNGSQYSMIADSLPNTKSYSWTIPLVKDTGALYKIKIQSSGSGVFSQNISPSFSITGASSDPYEPNNSTATAFLITDTDVLLTGAYIPLVFAGDSQDVDYFCFNGLANYTVNIQTYAPAGSHKMAGSLTLFDLDGVTALRTNSNSVDSCIIRQQLSSSGRYFFAHRGSTRESWGNYAFTFSLSVSSVEEDSIAEQITELALFGCAPNPFNPVIRIEIGIPHNQITPASLEIYDMLGRLCSQLTFHNHGRITIPWDALDTHGQPLSSGVYLLRLSNQKRELREKLILAR